jgi:hypothetical protein
MAMMRGHQLFIQIGEVVHHVVHYSWLSRVFRRIQLSQTPIILPETVIALGLIALLVGHRSAAAFADLASEWGVRFMGALMVLGGGLISWSYIKYDAFKETIGLVFSALGTAIYAFSVLYSLGVAGLLTGVGFTGITMVFISRTYFIILAQRSRQRITDAARTEGDEGVS